MLKPIAVLAPLALLCACSAGETPHEESPLAGASIGGPFELENSKGETVRWSDFDGKYRIVYFGYAYCPDACPWDVSHMMRGYERFKQDNPQLAAQVQPLFITIDPQRDTPEVVGQFATAFSDDLIGLTGTPEQIAAAAKEFSVYYARGEGTDENYLMDHSRTAYLMGREGQPIALLPVDVDDKGEAVAAELEKWVS